MTHSLHRIGSGSTLSDYFIVLFRIDPAIDDQITYHGPPDQKAGEILQILRQVPLLGLEVQTGDGYKRFMKGWPKDEQKGIHRSSSLEEIFETPSLKWVRHVLLRGKENLIQLIKRLEKADLGVSVVVSGVFEEIALACREARIGPHSMNMSLGIWGKKSLLPDTQELALATMCGHSLISGKLIRKQYDRVAAGKADPHRAAIELGRQCTCNIFNIHRAAKLFT